MAKRDAVGPYKGYTFQRIYAIKLILDKYNDSKNNDLVIQEEDQEDIKIINNKSNKIDLYQIKYYNSSKESITKDSGIMKVIKSHYTQYDNINNIHIIVASDNEKNGYKNAVNTFKKIIKEHPKLIGKYLIMAYHEPKKFKKKYEDNIKFINNFNVKEIERKIIESIEKRIEVKEKKKKDKINKFETIFESELNTDDEYKFYKHMADKNNVDNIKLYMEKFIFKDRETYNSIHDEIITNIKKMEEFKHFVETYDDESEKYKLSQSELIFGLLIKLLIDNLFNGNEGVLINNMINKIKNKLSSVKKDDIYTLILNYYSKIRYEKNENIVSLSNIEENIYLENLVQIFIGFSSDFVELITVIHNKDIIRKIIGNICKNIEYNALEDDKFVSFIHRLITNRIKMTGNEYKSLNNLMGKIREYRSKKNITDSNYKKIQNIPNEMIEKKSNYNSNIIKPNENKLNTADKRKAVVAKGKKGTITVKGKKPKKLNCKHKK